MKLTTLYNYYIYIKSFSGFCITTVSNIHHWITPLYDEEINDAERFANNFESCPALFSESEPNNISLYEAYSKHIFLIFQTKWADIWHNDKGFVVFDSKISNHIDTSQAIVFEVIENSDTFFEVDSRVVIFNMWEDFENVDFQTEEKAIYGGVLFAHKVGTPDIALLDMPIGKYQIRRVNYQINQITMPGIEFLLIETINN